MPKYIITELNLGEPKTQWDPRAPIGPFDDEETADRVAWAWCEGRSDSSYLIAPLTEPDMPMTGGV